MIPTFALLALAVLALWLGPAAPRPPWRAPWLWLGIAAVTAGLLTGILDALALVGIAAFGAAAFGFSRRADHPRIAAFCAGAIILLATGLMLHRVPGFHNPCLLAGVRFTPDASPFSLYLNFDKTLVGLCLLGWCHVRIHRPNEWLTTLRLTAPRALAIMAAVLVLSLAAGYVRFAPKLPSQAGAWLAVNLLSTCVTEEAFFRGFLQRQLQRLWSARAHGALLALAICAVLFGLAHAAGGLAYVLLATVAGLGYGWVYLRTGRIEASILTHFALNTAHFFLFTYPALQR